MHWLVLGPVDVMGTPEFVVEQHYFAAEPCAEVQTRSQGNDRHWQTITVRSVTWRTVTGYVGRPP
jgi:hypothetical protein